MIGPQSISMMSFMRFRKVAVGGYFNGRTNRVTRWRSQTRGEEDPA